MSEEQEKLNFPIREIGKQIPRLDTALASDIFDKFCNATTLKTILGYHRQLCEILNLKPNHFPAFYPKLKQYVNSWRAKALWKKFDLRASHKCYARGKSCPNTRVLIVGAGPCGLRTAIEAQLLGAKVVVVEKRDRMSRNNVLHLWPFVIEDLRALGAKKFFGKFCAGAIDHISIRQLQCILLKVALLLGVEIHTEVSFMKLVPPPSIDESQERIGWRGMFNPTDHPVSQYEFDVLIGADGRRNTLEGFRRKEFRGRLAIAITANFINRRTEAEARVEEISGVAFIFNQKFFRDLHDATNIDLENIVYYKDDTHYFVMTAKKSSLLYKGVILNDIADTSKLLARENVDVEALQSYAREAADFSTQYQMPNLEFAVNHYGNPDVNMFDFTSMYAAENASKVLERNGHKLLMILVGDSLLEPFWPTGSGCARGFLSSLDACWAIRGWGSGSMTPLEVLAERESIYRLLGQTTPENLQRDSKSYTLDPSTRYPNLNKNSLVPLQVTSLYDSDDPIVIKSLIVTPPITSVTVQELHKKRRRKDSQVHPDTLLLWLKRQVVQYDDLIVWDLTSSFKNGLVLCAIIHRYRPDLLDYNALDKNDFTFNNQLAFDILEKELGIPPVMTGQEMANCEVPDFLTMLSYITQIYDIFRGEIPHIKQPKLKRFADQDSCMCKFVDKIPSITNVNLPKNKLDVRDITADFLKHSFTKNNFKIKNDFKKPLFLNNSIISEHDNLVLFKEIRSSYTGITTKTIIAIYIEICSATEKQMKVLRNFYKGKFCEPSSLDSNIILTPSIPHLIQYFDTNNDFNGWDENVMSDTLSTNEDKNRMLNEPSTKECLTNTVDNNTKEKPIKIYRSVETSIVDLPETKKCDKSIQSGHRLPIPLGSNIYSRVGHVRHKRSNERLTDRSFERSNERTNDPTEHLELPHIPTEIIAPERKTRKRRSADKVGSSLEERQKRLEEITANRNERISRRKQQRRKQTEQFIKSMQMLHTNAKLEEGGPFEDYSIFLYRQTAPNFEDRVKDLEKKLLFPDRDIKVSGNLPREKDEDFTGRIKDFEEKLRETVTQEKKPKDLLRAIGKIETTDWNVKEIEKKIIENKMGKSVNKEKERVPKWSTEQFLARRTKMEKRGLDRQDSEDKKFAAIDKSLKQLDQKLKEGSIRELNQNKVSSITQNFKKEPTAEAKPIQKSGSKVIIPSPGGSENCHFCAKRVYLMERLSAEGRFFHRGCFRCQYCNTTLRLGSYTFDRDGKYGYKFYCSQHFGMSGQLKESENVHKRKQNKSPDKLTDATTMDLIDRVQTPERIEFSNMSPAGVTSDHEESFSQMDEDEWTDRNFGASTAEIGSSDEDSSDSDSESDDEIFEEALDEPVTKEGTQRLAKEWVKRYSRDAIDDDSGSPNDYDTGSDLSYENSSDDDDSDTATEGEEEIRARELRKKEVQVKQPIVQTDTGSDTELQSDEESSNESSSDKENSATDIPTDSEFDHDDRTPTGEIPAIMFNDEYVTKTRGIGKLNYYAPKKVQVKSGELQRPLHSQKAENIELKFSPLPASTYTSKNVSPNETNIRKPVPFVNPRKGDYLLNRTQSTGGIASKVSLELKKKYLLGNSGLSGSIQKSGSATTLDSKFKSFHSNISEHQKLLNPAPEISPSMQAFLQGTSKICTPLSPPMNSKSLFFLTNNDKKDNVTNSELKLTDLPKSIPTDNSKTETTELQNKNDENQTNNTYANDTEGRPRSPVHETSIIVPEISWNELNKSDKKSESDIDTDSLSSDSSDLVENKRVTKIFQDIPRVEVHDTAGELLQEDDIVMDSLCIVSDKKEIEIKEESDTMQKGQNEVLKLTLGEKKKLNQPKVLPYFEDISICYLEKKKSSEIKEEKIESKVSSGRNTPVSESESICNDATTAALTETELSDWARDGAVSDNLEDVELNINPEVKSNKKVKTHKKRNVRSDARIAMIEDFEDTNHVCGKEKNNKDITVENGAPIADLDSIEYMDTGSEVSLEDNLVQISNSAMLKNRGYVHFVCDDKNTIPLDSLNTSISQENNNEIVEAVNHYAVCSTPSVKDISEYCRYNNENKNEENINVIEKEDCKQNQNICENEEDSLLIIEPGTTTEENTVSDSTVKNLINKSELHNLSDKSHENANRCKEIVNDDKVQFTKDQNGLEYDEHVKRLQIKYADFGFIRDSIDIKKSKRKNKPETAIVLTDQKETEDSNTKRILSPVFSSPATLRKLEEINKERSKQHDLIRDLVLDKVKIQRKSTDKKRRICDSFSPSCSPIRKNFELMKSATVDITPTFSETKQMNSTEKMPSQKSSIELFEQSFNGKENVYPSGKTESVTSAEVFTPVTSIKDLNPKSLARPLSMHDAFIVSSKPLKQSPTSPVINSDSLPNIHQGINEFKTPVALPRTISEETRKTVEKLKQDARTRAKLMSDEELGLSPEDVHRQKINKFLTKKFNKEDQFLILNTEQRNRLLLNDTLRKKRQNANKLPVGRSLQNSFSNSDIPHKLSLCNEDTLDNNIDRNRTKSVSELTKKYNHYELKSSMSTNMIQNENENKQQMCKSEPNLLTEAECKKGKKTKDRERRKSIIKSVTEFFQKKKDSPNKTSVSSNSSGSTKDRFSRFRISPKSKEKSKEKNVELPSRSKSLSENISKENTDVSPPPIPPPPLHYSINLTKENSGSEAEYDWRKLNHSLENLDDSVMVENSGKRKSHRFLQRPSKQATIKRHRLAQEIQRKLEETEVKTRELEKRGVMVEKALRGETTSSDPNQREEADLLQEWFDLMRDRTELRRYEKELLVRAQELELEDRHARLQQELRERLATDDKCKTQEDVEAEGAILSEMLEIVAQRDSLIALLEEDRQRYHEEDKDVEAQMLAKGLRLTPIKKTPD